MSADPTASSTGSGTRPHARPRLAKARSSRNLLQGVCGVWCVWAPLILNYSIRILFDRPWSRLVLSWLSPLIMVGFTRPLEKDGMWLV